MTQPTIPTCEDCLPTLEGKILLCKLHAATAGLLEAAKKAEKWFAFYYRLVEPGEKEPPQRSTWNYLKAAIAKAE